jgi:ubiquinone/menaquinone biosynthesis C-methylase UbiE
VTSFRPHQVEWTDEKVARFWDYLARQDAGEFFSEKHAPDLVARLVRAAHPGTAVDIGCGTGPLVEELANRGINAIGVDSSQGVLDAARQRVPGARFELGSVTALPFVDQSIDAATLIEVVEHLDDETLHAAITEVARILRPGGVLMVTTPNAEELSASTRQCPDCGAEFHVYQHVRRWTASTLHAYLDARRFSAKVHALRFVERGPMLEQRARRAWYSLRRQRPRLLAIATRAG